MQTTSIKNVDNKHAEWKIDLGFYKDELKVFKERLGEVAKKNTGKEVAQMVEHFQNQFLIQSEKIDILKHDINEHISVIAKDALQNAGHVAKDQISAHLSLKERVEKEELIFKELKEEFRRFLSKLM